MVDADVLGTIDLIYSAATDPAAWNAVLRKLAAMTGCIAGGLTIEDPFRGSGRPLTFFGFDPDHVRRCFDHFLPMNPLFAIEARMQPGFVVANEMVVETPAFRKSDFYQGWARPQGLCSPLSLVLHRDAGRYIPLTLVRPDAADPASDREFGILTALAPHLIRAMDVSLALGRLDTANRALEDSLDRLDAGIVLLDAGDRVVRLNRTAEAYLRQGAIDIRDKEIRTARAAADCLLRRTLAARRHAAASVAEEILVAREGLPALVFSLIPFVGAEEHFDAGHVTTMLVIRPAAIPPASPGPAVIAGFATAYGLTVREQTILELLAAEGLSPGQCARRLGISLATVRTHLQRIFDKTGTRRQGELLAKLFQSRHPQRH